MTELEKKAQEIAQNVTEFKQFISDNKGVKADFEALQLKYNALDVEFKALQAKETVTPEQLKAVDDALNALNTEFKAKQENEKDSLKSFETEIKNTIGSEEFKTAFKNGELKRSDKNYELKVDTSAFTGNVSITQMSPNVRYAAEHALTVTPLFSIVPMGAGSKRMAWIEGSFKSNVGYIGEGTAQGTEDTGTEEEKYRELAKVSAKMTFTEEMFEDLPAFAARLKSKLVFNVQKFLNQELVKGDGDDSSNKKHIYGLKTKGSVAFSAGDLASSFEKANIDDLAEAMNVQADVYTPGFCLMNKLTIAKYSRVKDATGQYVIRKVDGIKVLGGMTLIESSVMGNNEMLSLSKETLELWVKRGLELKVGQEKDNLSTDSYTAVVFLRAQALVEGDAKKGNIFVSDIDTALVAINKA